MLKLINWEKIIGLWGDVSSFVARSTEALIFIPIIVQYNV